MNKTVLIADDSRLMRMVLAKVLQDAGFSVISASNGQQALSTLRQHQVDAVILDAVMPELDGLEACRQIRADTSLAGLPVFIFTGSISVVVGDCGADQVLYKKPDFTELIGALNQRLAR